MIEPPPKYTLVSGDTAPDIQETIKDTSGAVVSLVGVTSKKFKMKKVNGAIKVDADATIVDAANGVLKYVWGSTDLDTPGYYDAEWEIIFSNGKKQTAPSSGPFRIRIREQAG